MSGGVERLSGVTMLRWIDGGSPPDNQDGVRRGWRPPRPRPVPDRDAHVGHVRGGRVGWGCVRSHRPRGGRRRRVRRGRRGNARRHGASVEGPRACARRGRRRTAGPSGGLRSVRGRRVSRAASQSHGSGRAFIRDAEAERHREDRETEGCRLPAPHQLYREHATMGIGARSEPAVHRSCGDHRAGEKAMTRALRYGLHAIPSGLTAGIRLIVKCARSELGPW